MLYCLTYIFFCDCSGKGNNVHFVQSCAFFFLLSLFLYNNRWGNNKNKQGKYNKPATKKRKKAFKKNREKEISTFFFLFIHEIFFCVKYYVKKIFSSENGVFEEKNIKIKPRKSFQKE